MSQFKASRPDPMKVLEDLRTRMAKVCACETERKQLLDEANKIADEANALVAGHWSRVESLKAEGRLAEQKLCELRDSYNKAAIEAFQIFIEDMRE